MTFSFSGSLHSMNFLQFISHQTNSEPAPHIPDILTVLDHLPDLSENSRRRNYGKKKGPRAAWRQTKRLEVCWGFWRRASQTQTVSLVTYGHWKKTIKSNYAHVLHFSLNHWSILPHFVWFYFGATLGCPQAIIRGAGTLNWGLPISKYLTSFILAFY